MNFFLRFLVSRASARVFKLAILFLAGKKFDITAFWRGCLRFTKAGCVRLIDHHPKRAAELISLILMTTQVGLKIKPSEPVNSLIHFLPLPGHFLENQGGVPHTVTLYSHQNPIPSPIHILPSRISIPVPNFPEYDYFFSQPSLARCAPRVIVEMLEKWLFSGR